MYYSQDDDVKYEVGDILTHSNTYDRSPVIEVVTFVGNEGVVLQSIGGIVGMTERYAKFRQVNNGWPQLIHKRNEEEYKEFLEKLKEKKNG